MEPFIGQIYLFPFNFAPEGWAQCNGQLMSIAENSALFSLLGTYYGGDGITTFGLPDLRGRASMNQGQGNGLSRYDIGERAGQENVTLTTSELPSHNHTGTLNASNGSANQEEANGHLMAEAAIYTDGAANQIMNSAAITIGGTGGNLPHENMMPYLVMNYCIALEGIYPSRS